VISIQFTVISFRDSRKSLHLARPR